MICTANKCKQGRIKCAAPHKCSAPQQLVLIQTNSDGSCAHSDGRWEPLSQAVLSSGLVALCAVAGAALVWVMT